jgi:tetratricopeptide (TPR) repeat protein
MGTLARVYREAGQLDKALPLAEQTLILKRAALGENHPETLNELAGLAVCLSAAGRWDKSLPLYEEVLRKRRDTLGPEHPDTLMSMGGLGAAYRRTSAPERAEAVLRECLELRRRLMPDAWETFYVQVNFGCALVDQKRFAEAEPILIAGFEGLSARAKQIAPSQRHALQAALGAIVVFYERWGKPDEAEKWRSKLSSATTPSSSTGARY